MRSFCEASLMILLVQLHHDIWDFDILSGLIIGRDLKDHIFLVVGDRFFGNIFDQLAHSARNYGG